jgi:hypothetical protein
MTSRVNVLSGEAVAFALGKAQARRALLGSGTLGHEVASERVGANSGS